MAAMELRPYQREAIEAIQEEWNRGVRTTLLVLPTGCGKTIVFCKLAQGLVRNGERILILAHRGELLDQAADKMKKATGLGCAVEKADQTCIGSWFRVVVGSVQTLMRPKRLAQFAPDFFDTIIVDEAHHAISDSYQKVLQHFSGANVLGVTATPDRGDMKDLGTFFESLSYEYTLPQAIRSGYLCPIKALTIPLKLDISSVGISSGDFKAGEIGTALDPYLDQIASEMTMYCAGRKTVVFLPLIKTSQKFRDILNEHGFKAAEVNGESDDRADTLAAFDRGEYDVLCNSMLLTEGWDCPTVDCIVVLRPTKIRSLYCQMVGRGTRLAEGKTHLLLLDFLWMTSRHDLCRPAALIADSEDVAEQMTRNLSEKAGEEIDIMDAEKQAEEDTVRAREEALAEQLALMRRRKKKLVDPLQFAMSIQSGELINYVPAFGAELKPASDIQKKNLERLGINPDDVKTSGEAEKILGTLRRRQEQSLATPKQIRRLEMYGFQHVGTWSFEAASNMISRIAAQGWRGAPKGVDPQTYVPPIPKHEPAADPFAAWDAVF